MARYWTKIRPLLRLNLLPAARFKFNSFLLPNSFLCLETHQLSPVTDPTTAPTMSSKAESSSAATTVKTKAAVVQKSGKDPLKTDAPMLNYIFDTHSAKGKHHHHDYKWGPHFDEADAHLNASTVTVQIGGTALLNCRVIYLQDKTVSIQECTMEKVKILLEERTRIPFFQRNLFFGAYLGTSTARFLLVSRKMHNLFYSKHRQSFSRRIYNWSTHLGSKLSRSVDKYLYNHGGLQDVGTDAATC